MSKIRIEHIKSLSPTILEIKLNQPVPDVLLDPMIYRFTGGDLFCTGVMRSEVDTLEVCTTIQEEGKEYGVKFVKSKV